MDRARDSDLGDVFMVRARRCKRCGGLLTSAQAVADGYGHVCKMKELQKQQAREEQAAAYEALGDWEYLGEFTITAYCPCEDCCGRWADGVTASGLPAGPGIVAVDRSVIPLGSTVVIDGQRYLAADTGVTGNRVDICMTSHEDTVAHGVRTAEVWVVS